VRSSSEDDDLTELGDGLLVVIELILGQDLRVRSEVNKKDVGKFLRCVQSRGLLYANGAEILRRSEIDDAAIKVGDANLHAVLCCSHRSDGDRSHRRTGLVVNQHR
jgi:hypothetical protein